MQAETSRTRIMLALLAGLVVAITLFVYAGTTGNYFVWDTVHYLVSYEQQISSLNIENLYWMLTSLEFVNWHPLTWFSWAVDYQLYGGLDPWGYHFSSNVIHALNSALVFVLALTVLRLCGASPGQQLVDEDRNRIAAAFLAALLFAVHPQHVESVAWVAERKDLLCQFFLLLTLLAYIKYTCCERSNSIRWYLVTTGLFCLAVMSKPMAVTLPALLLLLDVYPLHRTRLTAETTVARNRESVLHLVLEKIPFFIISAGLAFITLHAQTEAIKAVALDLRLLNAFNSLVLYLDKLLLPLNLSPHYPYSVNPGEPVTWEAFVPVVICLGITVAAVVAWFRRHRAWLIAWLFFIVSLSPVLGIIQVGIQGAADRYTYFPTLPVYLLIAAGIVAALQRLRVGGRALVLSLVFILLLPLSWITQQQIQVWENQVSLWSRAVHYYPDSVLPRQNLGIAYFNNAEYEKSIEYLSATDNMDLVSITMFALRGQSYLKLGRFEEAFADHISLVVAVDSKPDYEVDTDCIQYNLAWIYAQLDSAPEALELFQRVSPASSTGADAAAWVNHLENAGEQPMTDQEKSGLPAYCMTVDLSEGWGMTR
jgi:tetratricopeptide (TPR) repeat protein